MLTNSRLLGLFTLLLGCSTLAAQRASSPGFFLATGEFAGGGSSFSTVHQLSASHGSGVVAGRSASTSYTLVGGFFASLETPVLAHPWVTALRPLRVPRDSSSAIAVHGAELHLGMGAAVQVGGRSATVTSRTRDKIDARLPRDVAPGWQPVSVTAGGKTTTLTRAVGILPMVDVERPAVPGLPFTVSYYGTQGDVVVWLLSAGDLPFRIPVTPYGYGLGLDLATLLVLGVMPVTDPVGRSELPLPGVPWTRPLHMQAVVLSTASYRPGSFTNVIGL